MRTRPRSQEGSQTHDRRPRARLWAWGLGLAVLGLGCALFDLMRPTPLPTVDPTPGQTAPAPTPGVTATATVPETATPEDTPTATPTAQPSFTPTPTPTATAEVSATPSATPTGTPSPTATASPEPAALAIVAFDVRLDDLTDGSKRLTCTWETTGATRARIIVGTSQRFAPWRDVPASGTTTFELASTNYANPSVGLSAFDAAENRVDETRTLDWPCTHTIFFAGEGPEVPAICPAGAPYEVGGAHQPFQGGSMIWIPGIEGQDAIFVLYSDQTWMRFEDTWEVGEPDHDPALIAPPGLEQPVRGFGEVWRTHPEVRDKLGWAVSPEFAFTATYQRQISETLGGVQYIRTFDGAIAQLNGLGGSTSSWAFIP